MGLWERSRGIRPPVGLPKFSCFRFWRVGLRSRAAEPIADICEDVSLSTAAEDYAWVNTRQIWGAGTVNFATGKIHIDAYMQ